MNTTNPTVSDLDPKKISRKGNYIWIAPGITAVEGRQGGMLTLQIRKRGKVVKSYRGSSLCFGSWLSLEDRRYLISLCEGIENDQTP